MGISRRDVIITGGGTAGHLYPALSVAAAPVRSSHAQRSILFVGTRRGLERELLPPTGYPYVLLPGRGIRRHLTISNLAAIAGLGVAFVRAVVIVGLSR